MDSVAGSLLPLLLLLLLLLLRLLLLLLAVGSNAGGRPTTHSTNLAARGGRMMAVAVRSD
jgi:hypothetical protein